VNCDCTSNSEEIAEQEQTRGPSNSTDPHVDGTDGVDSNQRDAATSTSDLNVFSQNDKRASCAHMAVCNFTHLFVNAGLVRVWYREQDLLCQAAASLQNLLKLRILNKCAAARQRCAVNDGGHVAGENCRRKSNRKKSAEAWKQSSLSTQNDLCMRVYMCVCVWRITGRTKPGSLLSSPPQCAAELGTSPTSG